MSRGINRVSISGKVIGKSVFDQTQSRAVAGSFILLSERYTHDSIVSVRAKINVYGEGLVNVCKQRVSPGTYAIIDGELMNRSGAYGDDFLEIRAQSVVFLDRVTEEKRNDGPRNEPEGG